MASIAAGWICLITSSAVDHYHGDQSHLVPNNVLEHTFLWQTVLCIKGIEIFLKTFVEQIASFRKLLLQPFIIIIII